MTAVVTYRLERFDANAKRVHLEHWKRIVDEVGWERFDQALTRHMNNSKFFPTPAELRQAAGVSEQNRQEMLSAEAQQQWEKLNCGLLFYADSAGCYWRTRDRLQLNPRAEAALRRMGGRERLEQWATRANWQFYQRDFIQQYLQHDAVETVWFKELKTESAGLLRNDVEDRGGEE